MGASFADVPKTARGHFQVQFYAAVFRLIHHLHTVGDGAPEQTMERFPFLGAYLQEMRRHMPASITWAGAVDWWQAEIEAWEEGCPPDLPMLALELPPPARSVLMTVGLIEEDARFGAVFSLLQGQARPTLYLIARLMATGGLPGDEFQSICRRLIDAGLLEAANPDAPRSAWELQMPPVIWDALRGEPYSGAISWCTHLPNGSLPSTDDLAVPPDVQRQLASLPALLGDGKPRTLVIRGMRGSERLEAAGAVARSLGLSLMQLDGAPSAADPNWRRIGALCAAMRAMPVVTFDPGPGETARLPPMVGYSGPVAVLLGHEGGFDAGEATIAVTLPSPGLDLRRRLWAESLAGRAGPDLDEIAARFHLPAGYIRKAGSMAASRAALEGRPLATLTDVREACRTLGRQMLDTLATHLPGDGDWDQIVLSEQTLAKLQELERRCRHREALLDYLGPAFRSTNRGVRALLTGPSGTGKTLAARTLAAVLGVDIYRVDLAAVVNKYIGETEKNLNQVLSRAEELDVILLLDEGDALMARRAEVKSATDRYANLETNYLLQRLETYQGIVLVTTNAGEQIDPAFRRRMDVVVHFLPPRLQERTRIWEIHLPDGHRVPRVFLDLVASRCELTGGQIRNAAMHATLLAVEEGAPVGVRHLEDAIQSEYRKAGALSPLRLRGGTQRRPGADSFVRSITGEREV